MAKVVLDEVGGKANYLFSSSQRFTLTRGLSESLAGMVSINELLPLSLREINEIAFNRHFIPTNEYLSSREKELITYEEGEIDLIIEENGILYPIEIKKSSNPTANDANAFTTLDKDINKKRGEGAIICTSQYKLKLRENLYCLPIDYI